MARGTGQGARIGMGAQSGPLRVSRGIAVGVDILAAPENEAAASDSDASVPVSSSEEAEDSDPHQEETPTKKKASPSKKRKATKKVPVYSSEEAEAPLVLTGIPGGPKYCRPHMRYVTRLPKYVCPDSH